MPNVLFSKRRLRAGCTRRQSIPFSVKGLLDRKGFVLNDAYFAIFFATSVLSFIDDLETIWKSVKAVPGNGIVAFHRCSMPRGYPFVPCVQLE